MNEKAGKYAGMDRYECRKALVEDLKEQGLLVKVVPHSHNVGVHDRCHTTVEPMIKQQWFVKMEPLAKPAIESVEKGEIKFVPERFTKNYMNWMKNTRDWCISRQLWWGHQIPAWYCDDCGETVVAKSAPCTCPKCGSAKLTRDPDTLDTWFSSALWPFSTLGWPNEDSADLKYFYPTNTLVTGYDIIGFWVSRMIFSGLAYTGKAPFDTVCIHGIVRDSQGRKMSKSLGNVINPDEVVDQYGADTMRLYEMFMGDFEQAAPWQTSAIAGCNRFLDRVWALSDKLVEGEGYRPAMETLMHQTIKKVSADIESLKMNTAIAQLMTLVNALYDNGGATKAEFETLVQLLNPFAPHMTEELWEKLGHSHDEQLAYYPWPAYEEAKCVEAAVEIAVQVNGKVKARLKVPADITAEDAIATAKADPAVAAALEGKQLVKEIYVKGRLVNLAAKG